MLQCNTAPGIPFSSLSYSSVAMTLDYVSIKDFRPNSCKCNQISSNYTSALRWDLGMYIYIREFWVIAAVPTLAARYLPNSGANIQIGPDTQNYLEFLAFSLLYFWPFLGIVDEFAFLFNICSFMFFSNIHPVYCKDVN